MKHQILNSTKVILTVLHIFLFVYVYVYVIRMCLYICIYIYIYFPTAWLSLVAVWRQTGAKAMKPLKAIRAISAEKAVGAIAEPFDITSRTEMAGSGACKLGEVVSVGNGPPTTASFRLVNYYNSPRNQKEINGNVDPRGEPNGGVQSPARNSLTWVVKVRRGCFHCSAERSPSRLVFAPAPRAF